MKSIQELLQEHIPGARESVTPRGRVETGDPDSDFWANRLISIINTLNSRHNHSSQNPPSSDLKTQ